MARRQIDRAIPFPYEGIRELTPLEDQPENTTAKAQNVRPFNWLGSDADRGRMGGGQRPGIKNFHTVNQTLRSSVSGFTHGNSIQSICHISTSNLEEMSGSDFLSVRSNYAAQKLGVSATITDIGVSGVIPDGKQMGGSGGNIHGTNFDLDDNLFIIRSTDVSGDVLTVEKWVFTDEFGAATSDPRDGDRDTWTKSWTSTSVDAATGRKWFLNGSVIYGDYLYLWIVYISSSDGSIGGVGGAVGSGISEKLLRLDTTSTASTPTLEPWIDHLADGLDGTITTIGKRGWRSCGVKISGNGLTATRGRLVQFSDFGGESSGGADDNGVQVIQRSIDTGEVVYVTGSGATFGANAGYPWEICADTKGNLWCAASESINTSATPRHVLFVVDKDGAVARLVEDVNSAGWGGVGAGRSVSYDAVNDRVYVVGRRDPVEDRNLYHGVADISTSQFRRSSFRAYHASEAKLEFVQQNVDFNDSKGYGVDYLGGFAAETFPFSRRDKVTISTTGTLPAPLSASTTYYLRNVALSTVTNTYYFKLSVSLTDASRIDMTDDGSADGTHTITRALGEVCRVKEGEASTGTAGAVYEYVVLDGGAGYDDTPTITISTDAGASSNAVAGAATISGGEITAIALGTAGAGYEDDPKVTITGGRTGGSDAVAIALVRRGEGDPISFTPRGMAELTYVRAKTNGSVYISHSEEIPASERQVNLGSVRVDNINQAHAGSGSGVEMIATAEAGDRLCDKMGVASNFALDQGITRSTRQTVTLAVGGGTVRRVNDISFQKVHNGDNALANDVPVIHAVPYGSRIFFADGQNSKYYDHPVTVGGIRGEVKDWEDAILTYSQLEVTNDGLWNVRAGKAKGLFPVDPTGGTPRLIEVWNGRIVLAGLAGLPAEWYMTRQNNPFDFDTSVEPMDPQQASSSVSAGPGGATDKINAMIPFRNDVLLFGGDHSILQMSGDPMAGARFDYLSTTIGMAWGRPWCKSPSGAAYFFGSMGGVYVVTPNQPPVDITNRSIRERMSKLNMADNIIRLAWNEREQGVHVFVSPIRSTSDTEHYYYDTRTGSWWIDKFEARWGGTGLRGDIYPHNAVAVYEFDGDAVGDRTLLLGGRDGSLYKWDLTAQSDYLGQTQTPISSNVYYGPFNLSNSRKVSLTGMNCTLAEGSSDVDYDVLVGKTAEEIVNATDEAPLTRFSGTWTAGKNNVVRDRAIAHDIVIKVKSDAVSTALTALYDVSDGTGSPAANLTLTVTSTTGLKVGDKIAVTHHTTPTLREVLTIAAIPSTTSITLTAIGLRDYPVSSTVVLVDKDWSIERLGITIGDTGRLTSRSHSVGKKA